MSRPRAPWWMYLVAASYLIFLVFIYLYVGFTGPSMQTGIAADFAGGTMTVKSVVPNSYPQQGGVQVGDRVLAVDGQVIRSAHDWLAVRANTEARRPQQWEVARADRRLQLTVTFPRAFMVPRWAYATHLSWILTTLFLGLVIAFRRPYDAVARAGASLLAAASFAFGFPDGWAVAWRSLPAVLGLLLWIPQIGRFVLDGILITFFAIFPRQLFRSRWPWILIWAPVLLPLPWPIALAYAEIYRPGHPTVAPEWVFAAVLIRSGVYLLGVLVALCVNYLRLENVNQKRRVRVLVAGVVISLLAAILWVSTPSRGLVLRTWSGLFQSILFLLMLALPFSLAYAILRHRLFDIRVMIRQGLQYTLARRVLLLLVPALGVILLADLLLHGQQPLVEILRMRGWVYAAVGVLALVAHARRERWLGALDRRFFRERYDAQRLLREVVEEVREAANFERVAPSVVARIEAALHPEFAALLVREPSAPAFRTLASAPSGQAPPPFSADSKLVALVRVLGKPLEVLLAESGWLKQQLPHEETDFLRQSRIDLLVPVSTVPGRTEAMLVLGVKRSEEPYGREDEDLLVAIAASLALLLEKPAVAPSQVSEAFEECPQCGTCYDTGAGRCAQEGASLIPMRLSRTLAGRYRLARRRGRGGMGAVYEAMDTALERRVAVKVIRDDLVGSADAAERFRREARAAASFTHPNVVTVHDFGVAADSRAFLVMELLEGVTLRDELKQNPRLAPSRTLEIMRGVFAAVEAGHRRQLIHRDLKPENIFLARSETGEIPKVLDFGIAKFLPASTQATADTAAGALVGTLHYMSPEQLHGESADAGWDLWALAVVAYEMLTGAPPFVAATSSEWRAAVLAGRFTPVSTCFPEVPARLQEFFNRAFAAERDRRFNSAQTFFSGMEQALKVQ